ncbi:MAG: hypothetical protein Q9181_008022, partial [Wetmoreana brouardii]
MTCQGGSRKRKIILDLLADIEAAEQREHQRNELALDPSLPKVAVDRSVERLVILLLRSSGGIPQTRIEEDQGIPDEFERELRSGRIMAGLKDATYRQMAILDPISDE